MLRAGGDWAIASSCAFDGLKYSFIIPMADGRLLREVGLGNVGKNPERCLSRYLKLLQCTKNRPSEAVGGYQYYTKKEEQHFTNVYISSRPEATPSKIAKSESLAKHCCIQLVRATASRDIRVTWKSLC